MLLDPLSPCYKLTHLLGPPTLSSVTCFMDGCKQEWKFHASLCNSVVCFAKCSVGSYQKLDEVY